MIPEKGIRIGKIFGIEIYLHWTWFIVFTLLFYLTVQYFQANTESKPYTSIPMAFATTILFFASVLSHEISHSLVANRNGIPIKRITLFIFGGMAQMSQDVTSPRVELKMAVAGPLSSYLLCVVFGAFAYLSHRLSMGTVSLGLIMLSLANFFLGTFNLFPGFPLDGGRVLRSILWHSTGDILRATRIASNVGIAMGTLLSLAGFIMVGIEILLGEMEFLVSGVWFIFIGMFLVMAAISSYRQTLVRSRTSHLKVENLYRRGMPAIDASASLEEAYQIYLSRSPHSPVPVFKQGKLFGVLLYENIIKVPPSHWSSLPVEHVARPVKTSEIADPSESLFNALLKMEKGKYPFLWVVREGRLYGILAREDIQRIAQVRLQG